MLLSFTVVQPAQAFGWLSPQWFNFYRQNTQTQPSTQTTTTTTTTRTQPTTTTQQSQPVVNQSGGVTSQERQMADMVNRERSQRGQRTLQVDPELSRWARIKSQDMVNNNYFAHQSPTYGRVSDMLRNGGVSFRFAAENLARAGSINTAHNSLMNSSIHRSNILNNNYTHVGIGIAQKGSTLYITQIFVAR